MRASIYVTLPSPLCHAHPNSLGAQWQLKLGASLQRNWAATVRRITNIFLSVLSNALPSLHFRAAFLLSCVAWMQVAILAKHPVAAVRASVQQAVHCLFAKREWDVGLMQDWIIYIAPRLPQSPCDLAHDLQRWLQRRAFWCGQLYASWHVRRAGPCSPFHADWSSDHAALQHLHLLAILPTHPRVDPGVHRGRGFEVHHDV